MGGAAVVRPHRSLLRLAGTGAAYLAAVAVGRFRAGALLAVASCALAAATLANGFTDDPTAYRHAAALIRQVDAAGERSCVVNIGVSPMLAYLDSPGDFAAVTDPLRARRSATRCWWRRGGRPTQAGTPADRRVIAEAERRFPHRLELPFGDTTLVLSDRPLTPPA